MYVLRPITKEDAPYVENFAQTVSAGVLNLPKKVSRLHQMIERALVSFKSDVKAPLEELYFFVLEDVKTGKVGGCSGIYSRTGVSHSIYFYKLEVITMSTKYGHLPISNQFQLLNPTSELEGPTELCALYMSPQIRNEGLGRLLSLGRMLFIASHPHRFTNEVVAELRGVIHKNGNSPFWDGLGRQFLNISFPELQAVLEDDKHFIAEILPRYPIYVALLPKEVSDVIRKTHLNTRPALEMLTREGFKMTDHVDLFDGGPTVLAKRDEIRTIQKNQLATVTEILPSVEPEETTHLISNTRLDYRACYGAIMTLEGDRICLRADVAAALQVEKGDSIRYISLT